ncbi:hypothetical protein HETIRDRAFT_424877 [Heterobasidion irregulare TC 32-1]|uniref:Uncharacterized protein n=1 Tax=Heterobasidion irregulare (strain TC 32-1) TaxID=747525 RepID=W4KIP7_HETIT|nr:uncharacterized protein HETIRDRAFT_424877 [Heterobasidion irregulare TC 32-1]ETW85722.1 hypothetical protein HETIRDRAFT_424877 [Heterobasidion irregulare TC 32-1]
MPMTQEVEYWTGPKTQILGKSIGAGLDNINKCARLRRSKERIYPRAVCGAIQEVRRNAPPVSAVDWKPADEKDCGVADAIAALTRDNNGETFQLYIPTSANGGFLWNSSPNVQDDQSRRWECEKKGAKGARGCGKKPAQLHIRKAEELADGGRCGDAAAACLAREKGGCMSRTTDVVDRRQYGDGPDRVPPCS